jgi:sporulation protein YlmC with PRC-barrel domain
MTVQTKTNFKVLSASSLSGTHIHNPEGEHLGELEEVMIDLKTGNVAYAVLSFGGFMGFGEKLFALPWSMLTVDMDREIIVADLTKETLKNAPGFDKDNWPMTPEPDWLESVYSYYSIDPYWIAVPR